MACLVGGLEISLILDFMVLSKILAEFERMEIGVIRSHF